MLAEWYQTLTENLNLDSLKTKIAPYADELINSRFSLSNPLFWLFVFLFLLLLSRRWGFKKAFSFCSIIVIILLATTEIENVLANTLFKSEPFDGTLIKIAALFFIAMITIYYFFIKSDEW